MEEQRAQISMMMLIVLLAIILGVFAFIVYGFVQQRPFPPPNIVEVNGQPITLSVNPDERADIVGDPQPIVPVVEEAPAQPVPEAETVSLDAAPTADPAAAPAAEVVVPTGGGTGGSPDGMYIFHWHTVQANDTLYSLAKQFNTTIPLLARFGTATLIPGNQVLITQANPAYCPSSNWYIARAGDSPGGIAAKYNTTLDVLNQLNGWNGVYAVYETNVICVP